jgi:hypothetical protein
MKIGGQGRIRTFGGVKPADLQSALVGHLSTCPELGWLLREDIESAGPMFA